MHFSTQRKLSIHVDRLLLAALLHARAGQLHLQGGQLGHIRCARFCHAPRVYAHAGAYAHAQTSQRHVADAGGSCQPQEREQLLV